MVGYDKEYVFYAPTREKNLSGRGEKANRE